MHFLAHIHTKDTNYIFGTPHTQYRYTQTNGHTQTHMHTCVLPLSHFALLWHAWMPKIQILHLACHRYTHAQIHKHMHTHLQRHQYIQIDTCTQTYRSKHADTHRHTCIFFYIHKHTYIYVRSILPAQLLFSCHLPNELRSSWTYF